MLSKTREELALHVLSTEVKEHLELDQLNQYVKIKYGNTVY